MSRDGLEDFEIEVDDEDDVISLKCKVCVVSDETKCRRKRSFFTIQNETDTKYRFRESSAHALERHPALAFSSWSFCTGSPTGENGEKHSSFNYGKSGRGYL